MKEVLSYLASACITLNETKCKFSQTRVTFLSHVIEKLGIHADPGKVLAIQDLSIPKKQERLEKILW